MLANKRLVGKVGKVVKRGWKTGEKWLGKYKWKVVGKCWENFVGLVRRAETLFEKFFALFDKPKDFSLRGFFSPVLPWQVQCD